MDTLETKQTRKEQIYMRFKQLAAKSTNKELHRKLKEYQPVDHKPLQIANIRLWGSRKAIPDIWLSPICQAFDVSLQWLKEGQGEMKDQNVSIPYYDLNASLGTGRMIFDEPSALSLPESFAHKINTFEDIQNTFIFSVSGDSMHPTITSNDLCIAYKTEVKSSDGIYLIDTEDGLMVKRLLRVTDGILIKSDNPAYEAWMANENTKIVAKIIKIFTSNDV